MGTVTTPKNEAKRILEKYRIKNFPVDIMSICKAENIDVFFVDFSEVEAKTKAKVSGMIQKRKDECFIFVNENDIHPRQRFTIAHELGHYFLHMDDNESAVITSFRMDRSPKESQANAFAAELLMPEEMLREEYEKMIIPVSDSLAKKFHVSKESMRIRLDSLELVYV